MKEQELRWFHHIYYAFRYGQWSCGCGRWKNKPQFGVYYAWYDGHWASAHLGPLWISCEY